MINFAFSSSSALQCIDAQRSVTSNNEKYDKDIGAYLDPKEGGKDDVGDDDQVDLVEEAAGHQDHQDQVHD